MPYTAIKFVLENDVVKTIISGKRNVRQAEMNTTVLDLHMLDKETIIKLRKHEWWRNFGICGNRISHLFLLAQIEKIIIADIWQNLHFLLQMYRISFRYKFQLN